MVQNWVALRGAFNDAAREHLDMKLDIVKEWISDNTMQLICKKCLARLQDRVDEYKQLQKLYRTNLRYDHQKWVDDKVMEAETLHDNKAAAQNCGLYCLEASTVQNELVMYLGDGYAPEGHTTNDDAISTNCSPSCLLRTHLIQVACFCTS